MISFFKKSFLGPILSTRAFYNSLSFKMEPVGAFEGTIVVGTYFHPRTCDLAIP